MLDAKVVGSVLQRLREERGLCTQKGRGTTEGYGV